MDCLLECSYITQYTAIVCTGNDHCFIGDSHNGQIDVCRLVAMAIWSWMWNVANRGQNVPVGSTPTDTIGPRSRSRLSARYVLVVLKWRKNLSIFKARRVFSFDIVQSDSFPCQAADEHNRETFACELIGHSHDGQTFDGHGHVHDNRSQSWVVGFTRKRLTIVFVGWLA